MEEGDAPHRAGFDGGLPRARDNGVWGTAAEPLDMVHDYVDDLLAQILHIVAADLPWQDMFRIMFPVPLGLSETDITRADDDARSQWLGYGFMACCCWSV